MFKYFNKQKKVSTLSHLNYKVLYFSIQILKFPFIFLNPFSISQWQWHVVLHFNIMRNILDNDFQLSPSLSSILRDCSMLIELLREWRVRNGWEAKKKLFIEYCLKTNVFPAQHKKARTSNYTRRNYSNLQLFLHKIKFSCKIKNLF